MELAHLDKKAADPKQLIEVQAAMIGEAKEDTWEGMVDGTVLPKTYWQRPVGQYVWQGTVYMLIKGALDKFNIIPQLFPKKVGIFIPLEVLAWVKTACWVLHSRLNYFWRNMNISRIFYFSKSESAENFGTDLNSYPL